MDADAEAEGDADAEVRLGVSRGIHTFGPRKKNAEPIFGRSMSRATSIFAVWSKQ